MRSRLCAIGAGALLVVCAWAGVASATGASGQTTQLSLRTDTAVVTGNPIAVQVLLRDGSGHPIGGALIRLVTTVQFMGSDHEEIVDEATTGQDGAAELRFAPVDTGPAVLVARFAGAPGQAPAEATLPVDVREAVDVYTPTPVGLQAPWARSYFILLPFLGIWAAYAVVIAQARRIRRAGSPATVVSAVGSAPSR